MTDSPIPTSPPPGQPPVADTLKRIAAYIIDILIVQTVGSFLIGILAIPFIIVIAAMAPQSGEEASGAFILVIFVSIILLLIVSFAMTWFYYSWSNCRPGERNGQTLGKQVVDIRVVCADGQPVTRSVLFRRYVVAWWIPATLTCGIYGWIDFLSALFNPERQTLHDRYANTYVVEAPDVPAPPTAEV